MIKLYPDTEKELFYETDYKPLPPLANMTSADIAALLTNLHQAMENAFIYHADLLCIALKDDTDTIQEYIRKQEQEHGKQAKQGD